MPKDTKENNTDNDHDDNCVDYRGNSDKCSPIENEIQNTSYSENNTHIYVDNDDSPESYDDDAGGKCILETFQRVRFFHGQLLTSEDLRQLTRYFNNKRHLINRQIIGTSGIVCGLYVNNVNYIQGCLNIDISNGFAIDCCGKEIIIARQTTHKFDFPRQFFNEKIKRFGLFVSRNDIKHSASVLNSLDSACDNFEEPSSMETRIEEGYAISLKPFENNLLGIEFNKKNYCITDKVIMEVWDPDNTLRAHRDKVIKVTSSIDQNGTVIKLKKLSRSSDFYRGEMLLSEKESIDHVQLKVNKTDIITASLDEQIREKAFVSSEDSFIYNQRQNIDNSFEYHCREYNNCDTQITNSFYNKNSKDVLIAIIKKDYQARKGEEGKIDYNVFLDKEESLLCRKIIYNNQMHYDLSTNKLNCNDPTETNLDKTIFISKTETYLINDIEPGYLKVMEPIKILDNDDRFSNEELAFPPEIYLGRVSHENKTDETVLFNEDMYCNSEGKIVIDGESFDPPPTTDKEIKSILENIKKEKDNLIFKPIDIRSKEKSFRIMLANPSRRISHSSKDEKSTKTDFDSDSSDTAEDKKEREITLRWWATCKFKRLD